MQENLPELPHFVEEAPKRSKWAITGILVLSLMVLTIPVGIYLVGQRTQLAPQAAVFNNPEPQVTNTIILESKLNPENNGLVPVDIYVKSGTDTFNLVNAQIKYDPNLLAVDKIATNAAELGHEAIFNNWLEVTNDNVSGRAKVIAGLPNPGAFTPNQDQKLYLGTLYLRPKASGSAVVQVAPESQILRNSDNQNIFQSGRDLVLNLSGAVTISPEPSKKPAPSASLPLIVITSPAAATNYSFFKPIEVVWSAFNVDKIPQINLLINGQIFGPIAQNLDAKTGKYTWQPQSTLAVAFIQLSNIFQIEITGVSKTGEEVKSVSAPFGIIGQDSVSGSTPSAEIFAQNQLTIDDASRQLSDYLVTPLADPALDLNKDGVINGLDFYLLRQNLLGRGVIK